MIVGSLRVRLLLREARTRKDKRQVVRSIIDRLRNQFNVSVAEVDALDDCRLAVLGVVMVSNEAGHVRQTLERITEGLRRHPVAEFIDHQIDIGAAE